MSDHLGSMNIFCCGAFWILMCVCQDILAIVKFKIVRGDGIIRDSGPVLSMIVQSNHLTHDGYEDSSASQGLSKLTIGGTPFQMVIGRMTEDTDTTPPTIIQVPVIPDGMTVSAQFQLKN
jgi:hypothetical protein